MEQDAPIIGFYAPVHRALTEPILLGGAPRAVAIVNALGRETDQGVVEPAKLIGPMLARFMATDRAFAKLRRTESISKTAHPGKSRSEQTA